MKVVVTGGAGFIGSAVSLALAAEESIAEVIVLDDMSTGSAVNVTGIEGAQLIQGSVLDDDALYRSLDGAASVVHLAARASVLASTLDPYSMHAINTTGTIRVLEACRHLGVPHFIVASSAAIYGAEPAIPTPESSVPRPESPYAASKLAAEAYAFAYARCFNLGVLSLRFFNVYGPRQDLVQANQAVVPAFVSAAISGQPVTIHGDGTQTRDFIFVESVARLISTAVVKGVVSDQPVNAGSGTPTSLLKLADIIGELIGRELPVQFQSARISDARHSLADVGFLRELFGDARPVDLRTGLSRTLHWYRTELAGDGVLTNRQLSRS